VDASETDHEVLPRARRLAAGIHSPPRRVAPNPPEDSARRRNIRSMSCCHRTERHHPRPARDQQERAAEGFLPDEIPADRATELQRVPGVKLVGEIVSLR